MTCIIDDVLYLGGKEAVSNGFLRANNVKTIINVASECNDVIEMKDIVVMKYEIDDSFGDIYKYFDEIISKIKDNVSRGGVLVHCYAGMSRSATIVMAYLIKEKHMNLMDAYTFVKGKRNIMPNPHFMKQLMKYEKEELTTTSYKEYIDDYVTSFLIDSLRIEPEMFNSVKTIYVKNDRNIIKTVMRLNRPDLFDEDDDEIIFLY